MLGMFGKRRFLDGKMSKCEERRSVKSVEERQRAIKSDEERSFELLESELLGH